MDSEFKVPNFEPKLKVPLKKDKPPVDDTAEIKETSKSTAEVVAKEIKSARVESELTKNLPKCPYVEPKWSQPPETSLVYSFEVLKGGQIVEHVNDLQEKAFWTIGKFQTNDIVMAHPTISRYHAVLQYRPDVDSKDDSSDSSDDEENNTNSEPKQAKPKPEKGWYLYDLSSTHGTFVNKMKVPPKTYIRIRVGYMLKFGASTRNYIFQGPGFDEEAESELTITEMKELRLKKQQEKLMEAEKQKLEEEEKRKEEEKRREEEGVSWGMADDADEETDLSINPYASTNNEELFLQDPKKTLRGFFEREGLNLDYKVDEVSNGTYVCRIELPITDSIGRSITAEFTRKMRSRRSLKIPSKLPFPFYKFANCMELPTHKGKKKECVAQCALEACRILDRNGLLRQANHEPRKRKVQSSDDDDDEFYDRTTEAEEKRRRKAGAEESVTLSYDQLIAEEEKLQSQLVETEKRIERYQQMEKASKQKEDMDVDDLDDFMSGLSSEKQMDKAEVRKCRFEVLRIKADIQKVKKLINIARPVELPPLQQETVASDSSQSKKKLPLFGKKKTFGFDKLKQQVTNKKSIPSNETKVKQSDTVEEFDDDENPVDLKVANQAEESIEKAIPKKHCVEPIEECATETSTKEIETATRDEKTTEKSPELKDNSIRNDNNDQLYGEMPNIQPGTSHKNKNKSRQRNKVRHQIDIDETEEDTSPQKYSGWVPPVNQSGDGITELNSKFGY